MTIMSEAEQTSHFKEIQLLKSLLKEKDEIIKSLKKELEEKNRKGSKCSKEGSKYEKVIHGVVKKTILNGKLFNSQSEEDLGGSGSKIDLECNFKKNKDLGIEAKKCNTPDWMQCSIKYHEKEGKWCPSKKGKIPNECQELFKQFINNVKLFGGDIPPFMKKKTTHEEWLQIKKETNKWNDKYIDIPNNIIKDLYRKKGCSYIQISEYGLYHLGNDICEFGVPEFVISQQIRIRTKIHARNDKKGFCSLSVTAACQPKDIKSLKKSMYSLDNKDKLPINLIYDSNP